MLPSPWVALVLVFAAYRGTRLLGWDDWPPIYKLRAWAIGEHWIPLASLVEDRRFTDTSVPEGEVGHVVMQGHVEIAPDVSLPGKQPSSEAVGVRPAYSRPLLAHLVHCPFCLGWWVSLVAYVAWLALPTATLYLAAPFALSGAVGIIAKNLDA
jgi:hypothetical protein